MRKAKNLMTTIYTSTTAHEINEAPFSVETTTYYTERKVTPEEYRAEFGKGYAVKKNQKKITVRDYMTKEQADKMILSGATVAYKN